MRDFLNFRPTPRTLLGMKWSMIILIALSITLTGCQRSGGDTSAAVSTTVDAPPTQAQGKLPTIRLWMGPEEMTAELATTLQEIRTGMMFRTNIDENAGMLFVFTAPHRVEFWMKNCPEPLSAAYIDPNGKILEIRELEPFNTNSVVAKTDRIQFVLETKRGYFDKKKIKPGVVIRTERGTLQETFFHR